MDLYNNGIEDESPSEITLEELEELELSCKTLISNAKSAEKLSQNTDFIEIIMKQYFENEPKRLGLLIASGKMTPKQNDDAIKDLLSIGNLHTFLNELVQKGNIAVESLKEAKEAREEFLNQQTSN